MKSSAVSGCAGHKDCEYYLFELPGRLVALRIAMLGSHGDTLVRHLIAHLPHTVRDRDLATEHKGLVAAQSRQRMNGGQIDPVDFGAVEIHGVVGDRLAGMGGLAKGQTKAVGLDAALEVVKPKATCGGVIAVAAPQTVVAGAAID